VVKCSSEQGSPGFPFIGAVLITACVRMAHWSAVTNESIIGSDNDHNADRPRDDHDKLHLRELISLST
jgi:hypothetical protein